MTTLPTSHRLARIAIAVVAAALVGVAVDRLFRVGWPQQGWHMLGRAVDTVRHVWARPA